MTKRFGILITAVLAFAIAPAVALAGDGDDVTDKKAERTAKLQTKVDSFVECLNATLEPDLKRIDVEVIRNARQVAHRGRHGIRFRGFRGHRDQANRIARFVVRHGELDRTEQAVRDAVKACRDEQRGALVTERQADIEALATCLVGKKHNVVAVDISERPRLVSKRGFLRRSARVMLRTADISLRDANVRADARACIQEVRSAEAT